MSQQQKPQRIRSLFVFRYAGALELRVEEEKTAPITKERAREIADSIHHHRGSLCADCHMASRIRTIRVSEPEKARCFDCHENVAVPYGYGTSRA